MQGTASPNQVAQVASAHVQPRRRAVSVRAEGPCTSNHPVAGDCVTRAIPSAGSEGEAPFPPPPQLRFPRLPQPYSFDGSRRITSVAEVVGLSAQGRVELRTIFEYRPEDGTHQATGYMPTFLPDLSRAFGEEEEALL